MHACVGVYMCVNAHVCVCVCMHMLLQFIYVKLCIQNLQMELLHQHGLTAEEFSCFPLELHSAVEFDHPE